MIVNSIPEIRIEKWYLRENVEGQFFLRVCTTPINESFGGDREREKKFEEKLKLNAVYVDSYNCYLTTFWLGSDAITNVARVIVDTIAEHNKWVRSENYERDCTRNAVYKCISDLLGADKEI